MQAFRRQHLHDGASLPRVRKIAAAVLTSTDPVRPHNVDERVRAGAHIPVIIRLGSRGAGLYERASLSLPTCTWAEKSGVYEKRQGPDSALRPGDSADG